MMPIGIVQGEQEPSHLNKYAVLVGIPDVAGGTVPLLPIC